MVACPGNADILAIRVEQELAELDSVRRCIEDQRVAEVAGALVGDRIIQLLENAGRKMRDQVGAASQAEQDPWPALSTAVAQNARIKREALALVLGALLRNSALDGGIQQIADRMFRALSARTGVEARVVASIGESEFLDRTLELARTRFPDTAVWGLPILAHEFGHFVARVLPHAEPELRGQVWPLTDLLADEADSDASAMAEQRDDDPRSFRQRASAHINEIFADVYATYALGACHPLAAMALRANLGHGMDDSPASETATHPSWARRITTMYEAMKAMSAATGEPRHRLVAENQIAPWWREIAGGEGQQDPLIAHAQPQAERIVQALIEHAPSRLRNRDDGQVAMLQVELEATTDPGTTELPEGSTVFHVLDAAWNWRASHWSVSPIDLARINRRALALYQRAAA